MGLKQAFKELKALSAELSGQHGELSKEQAWEVAASAELELSEEAWQVLKEAVGAVAVQVACFQLLVGAE
jgi:hypothetical protein